MTEKQLQYQLADKSLVPLFEADHDMAFKIYRADQRKAVIADPLRCIEAKGLCRLKGVTEAYVGSGGDAYVIFEWSPNRPYPHAVHFTIPRKTAKPRDAFDAGKKIPTQELHLRMPTKGRTRAHRTNLMKARNERIKAGKHAVKKRAAPRKTRVERIGVPHRPRAKTKAGVVSLIPAE